MNIVKTFLDSGIQSKKLLISVSGGVDSMVLLDLCIKNLNSDDFAVFHLNHGVREQANNEYELVEKVCLENNIKFYGNKLKDIPLKDKENFWRKERKRFLKDVLLDFGAEKVLTAHHSTDLVETMIFRLTKGVGVSGLSPFDISTKPLWKVSKNEIKDYAEKNNIEYLEDLSNNSLEYERNRIRQNILPELRKITPNLEKVFVQESIIFSEVGDFLEKEVLKLSNEMFLSDFIDLHIALKREFLRRVSKKTPSFSEIEDALKWLLNNPEGNTKKEIGGTILLLKKGRIFISSE